MRKVEYLSPSGIALYVENPSDFYLRYLSDNKPPNMPQNQPMSIGSAFDAYVKSYLYEKLFGTRDGRYELRTLFEAQVEEQNRDWAWQHGAYVFEQYKQSGVLGDLMMDLQGAVGEPRFEFEIRGVVNGYREGVEGRFGNVVLLGKPDVDFVTKDGVHCILDFKVNGYCSKYSKSPAPYYLRMRSAGRTNHGMHKKCVPLLKDGLTINYGCHLEDIDEQWARQLAIYGWLCGEAPGSEFITVIHQVVCNPNTGCLPTIRVAEHYNRIGKGFQQRVFDLACEIWDCCHSDHFFRNMTKEQSASRCRILDKYKENTSGEGNEMDAWFKEMVGQ
jgi:hypothetical protein